MTYVNNVTDTLWADVSEFQVPYDSSYANAGYKVISIRSNDGTYLDHDWVTNYPRVVADVNSGLLDFFIVYFVWRTNWLDDVNAFKAQVGIPHPKMAVMLDVESWSGQIGGDQSDGINRAWWNIHDWLGVGPNGVPRVLGYANLSDFNNLWPVRPDGLRMVGAGYPQDPRLPGEIGHQYTDGTGYGAPLPQGAPPFNTCDMNSADGLSVDAFAAALGVGSNLPPPPPPDVPTFAGIPVDDQDIYSLTVITALANQLVGAL